MPEYLLTCRVECARGTQEFIVQAENETEAIKLFNEGKYEFAGEEIEVMDLGLPEVELNE